jgi:hypothetical protein
MPDRSDILDAGPEHGPCWFVYLLSLADCSAFKAGFSCNPLQRIYSFSHRYFERFDLHQSRLLQVRTLEDARSIEATLKSELAEFRADCPPWIMPDAGGYTEWFSAVYFGQAHERLQELMEQRTDLQLLDARELIHGELTRHAQTFESWAWSQAQLIASAPPPMIAEASRLLRDWLDAYLSFGIPLFVGDPAVQDFVRRSCERGR